MSNKKTTAELIAIYRDYEKYWLLSARKYSRPNANNLALKHAKEAGDTAERLGELETLCDKLQWALTLTKSDVEKSGFKYGEQATVNKALAAYAKLKEPLTLDVEDNIHE